MIKQIDLKEAIGKTIANIQESYSYPSPQLALVFADGTFTVLGISRGYGEESEIDAQRLDVEYFGDLNLIKAGIMTEEEVKTKNEAKQKKMMERKDRYDLEQYQKLQIQLKERGLI